MVSKSARRSWGVFMLVGLVGCGPATPEEIAADPSLAGPQSSTEMSEDPAPFAAAAKARQGEDGALAGSWLCEEGQTFVTNEQLEAVGFGVIANGESAGTCLEKAEWESMQRDASRLLAVEIVDAGEQQTAGDREVSAQASEYYIKNTTSTTSDTRIDTFQCKNYHYSLSQGCSVSLSGKVTQNINMNVTAAYGVVSGSLGYSITWEDTKTYTSSTTVPPRKCVEYRFYANYKVHTFELWEDDIWFDDYIGTYKTRKYNYTWVGQYSCSL